MLRWTVLSEILNLMADFLHLEISFLLLDKVKGRSKTTELLAMKSRLVLIIWNSNLADRWYQYLFCSPVFGYLFIYLFVGGKQRNFNFEATIR